MTSTPWYLYFFFNDTATTEIYTLSLHDALPISVPVSRSDPVTRPHRPGQAGVLWPHPDRAGRARRVGGCRTCRRSVVWRRRGGRREARCRWCWDACRGSRRPRRRCSPGGSLAARAPRSPAQRAGWYCRAASVATPGAICGPGGEVLEHLEIPVGAVPCGWLGDPPWLCRGLSIIHSLCIEG